MNFLSFLVIFYYNGIVSVLVIYWSFSFEIGIFTCSSVRDWVEVQIPIYECRRSSRIQIIAHGI